MRFAKFFLFFTILILPFASLQAAISPHQSVSKIDALSLKGHLKAKEVVIVDVRSASDFELGHIRGAISGGFPKFEAKLPKNKSHLIVLYDDIGQSLRVENVALRLRTLGYLRVKVLNKGLRGWIAQRLPMISG